MKAPYINHFLTRLRADVVTARIEWFNVVEGPFLTAKLEVVVVHRVRGGSRAGDTCRNCREMGHWARECRPLRSTEIRRRRLEP